MFNISNNNIKVSVIVTVYNGEHFLKECLDSLRKQSIKEIEIICVDDGSTDESINILSEYKKMDSRLKIIKKEHSNAGDSRNYGLKSAKGEYLLFLDCDDIFNERLCEAAYTKAKEFDAEIVFYEHQRMSNNGEGQEYTIIPLDSNIKCDETFSADDIEKIIFQITTPCAWTKMFKRKFVRGHGLKFQSIQSANDMYFTRAALT